MIKEANEKSETRSESQKRAINRKIGGHLQELMDGLDDLTSKSDFYSKLRMRSSYIRRGKRVPDRLRDIERPDTSSDKVAAAKARERERQRKRRAERRRDRERRRRDRAREEKTKSSAKK
eukprot:TRINITY_DN3910_c0_g1_i1.p1 TRINITY_DN3910_c0_g1~~TRINITY_DN3910_c0_g1_i1.p1  ORF type:complete len:120 (-),score=23.09 TRINITY_DN3910_c0_g1_i1:355-714(-)